MKKLILLLMAALALSGCESGKQEEGKTSSPKNTTGNFQAVSFLGDSLFAPQLSAGADSVYRVNLKAAREEYKKDPGNADAIIWHGRRLAYTGDYRKAVAIFTEGIRKHPADARMYRHRGHRYISLRQPVQAIADFEKAAELIKGTEDKVEPDGLPNARNIPVSTLHSNIWYHLGLAYYLKDDLEKAVNAYRECLKASKNNDNLVSTSHWLYMALRKLRREKEAAEVLVPVKVGMDIIENTAYYNLLLFYKGELTEEDLTGGDYSLTAAPAVMYGLGNWYFYNVKHRRAKEIFVKILESDQWAPFGYIAAEADLSRGRGE